MNYYHNWKSATVSKGVAKDGNAIGTELVVDHTIYFNP